MIKITKLTCPPQLIDYARHEPLDIDEPFRDREVKMIIKKQLLVEQKYICAYCMTPIQYDNMVIEHIEPKGRFSSKARAYSNLLATCDNSYNHCDKSKGEKDLLIANPLTFIDIENEIKYSRDGRIDVDIDTPLFKDINETLNLNTIKYLIRNRKQVIEDTKKTIDSMISRGFSKVKIQNMISKILVNEKKATHATPYSGVMRYEFKKYL